MSVGNKVTILYAGVFAIMFFVLTVFIILNTWYYYRDVSKNELDETINKVFDYIKSGGAVDTQNISKLKTNKNVDIRVVNINKKSKFEVMDEPSMFPPPIDIEDGERREAFENDPDKRAMIKGNKFENEIIRGLPYMYYHGTVEHDGETYLVEVFRQNYHEQSILKTFGIIFIIANIFGIFLAFVIGRYISKLMLKPVVEMTETASEISINDLSRRIAVPVSNDEMKTLALTFNDMIERLEISFQRQKQFISDASHELKTPISVIQGYAGLMDRWGKSDPEILQESIDSIKDETEHMSTLIKRLLFLAKDERNFKELCMRELLLNDVLQEVKKEVSVLEIKNNILFFEDDKDVYIRGDFNLIKQLTWIFIENAIKYTEKEKCIIEIRLAKVGSEAQIIIKDNGIGISEEDIPCIFDRFFRSDKSRCKTTPGNGLGLSIADMITKQHNGHIEVLSKLGEGTTFVLKFNLYTPLESEE